MSSVCRVFACLVILGWSLYSYIHTHNQLIALRMRVPELAAELKRLDEEEQRLQFTMEQFEDPVHLMELARKPEFAHLKHPTLADIITVGKDKDGETTHEGISHAEPGR